MTHKDFTVTGDHKLKGVGIKIVIYKNSLNIKTHSGSDYGYTEVGFYWSYPQINDDSLYKGS